MAPIASFIRWKFHLDAGSGNLNSGEESQFTENRTISAATPSGYYSMHVFEMKNSAGVWGGREKGMFGVHWINLTAGEPDTTWITADYTAVESAVEAFWTSMKALISTDCRLTEHRWYAYGGNVLPPNPPSRVQTLVTPNPGTSATPWVHQTGGTVTLRTGLRRHWGRIYFPFSTNFVGTGGQSGTSDVDSVASAARTMLMISPSTQGIIPVVWDRSRKIGFGVTAIEVDSVPDIQRRRRPRDTAYKKIYTS